MVPRSGRIHSHKCFHRSDEKYEIFSFTTVEPIREIVYNDHSLLQHPDPRETTDDMAEQ